MAAGLQPVAYSGLSIVMCSCPICTFAGLVPSIPKPVPPGLGNSLETYMSPMNRVLTVGDSVGVLLCGATIIKGSSVKKVEGKPVAHLKSKFSVPQAKFLMILQNNVMTKP